MPRRRGSSYRPAQGQHIDDQRTIPQLHNGYVLPIEPNYQQPLWPIYDNFARIQTQAHDPNVLAAAYYAGDASFVQNSQYYQQPTSHAWPHTIQAGMPPTLARVQQSNTSRYPLRSRINQQTRPYVTDAYADVVESIEARDQLSQIYANNHFDQPARFHDPRSTSRSSRESSAPPMKEPTVSETYQKDALKDPQRLSQPKKLLVVLDLNGTFIVRKRHDPQGGRVRPGAAQLLEYLFDNHVVMVSTSTRLVNAEKMLERLMTPDQRQKLIAIRARETFGLTTAQYNSKVQIYKNLDDIWSDPRLRHFAKTSGLHWSQANTVLIDDSILKAKAQPHNLLQVEEFMLGGPQPRQPGYEEWELKEMSIMQAIQHKLELLKWQKDVSCQIRRWQVGETENLDVVIDTHSADVVKVSKLKKKHRKQKQRQQQQQSPEPSAQSIDPSIPVLNTSSYLMPRSTPHEFDTNDLDNNYITDRRQNGKTRTQAEDFLSSSNTEHQRRQQQQHYRGQRPQQQPSPPLDIPASSHQFPSAHIQQAQSEENLLRLDGLKLASSGSSSSSSNSSTEDLTSIKDGSCDQTQQQAGPRSRTVQVSRQQGATHVIQSLDDTIVKDRFEHEAPVTPKSDDDDDDEASDREGGSGVRIS